MGFTREQMLEKLKLSYAGSYDINDDVSDPECPALAATAHFHVNESKYMINPKAKLFSVTSDEYVWFFSVPRLEDAECQRCIQYAYDHGMPLCVQDGEQMVTRLAAVFICDELEDKASERIRKCSIYKNFQFGLKGWMEFHAAAADLGKETAVANRYGRDTAQILKALMLPPEKRGKRNKLLAMLPFGRG